MAKKREPSTEQEWKEAVDMAALLLALDSARIYGLVNTDIVVNVSRCQKMLSAEHGYSPRPLETIAKELGEFIPGDRGSKSQRLRAKS